MTNRLLRPAAFLSVSLVALAALAGTDASGPYGPHPDGSTLDPVRQAIIGAALGEVGKVSDIGGRNGMKKGWEELKRYFDEASDWGPDCFKKGRAVEYGIKRAGRNPPGGEWCGIFATWCCVQAGIDTRWRFGRGPAGLELRTDIENVAPGDIGVIARYVHHFVVASRDGDTIECVNGNSIHHSVSVSSRSVHSLVYYYRTSQDVWLDGAGLPVAGGDGGAKPHPMLRFGSRGEAVHRVQELLVYHGYWISVSGVFDADTRDAVESFQADQGLAADGIVGPLTWNALEGA